MPKSKQEYENIRQEAKNKIFSSAIEVFAKKGYAATRSNDIALAANVSVGLLYRYFNSKQELFEEIVNLAVKGLVELTNMLGSDGNPKDIINMLYTEILNEMSNDDFINMSMIFIQGALSENKTSFEVILNQDKLMFSTAAKLIKRGQDQGLFKPGNPDVMSSLMFSTIQGIVMMKFIIKEDFILPTISEITSFLY